MKPDFANHLPLVNIKIAAVCLILERNPENYILTLMLPSTLLCIMAFATFIAPPDSGERISLGVSMVLGLTVFQLLVADILPSTNERPILSSYLISTFVLACLAVPASLLNINIAYGDRSILVLKYTFSRKLFLEYLPRMTVVPSYSERIRTLMEETAQTELRSSSINGIGPKLDSAKQISLESEGKHISKAEKAKIQARTVALVMDRLVSLVFITVFAVLVIKTLIDFSGNSGAQSDICQSFDKMM
ncbi:acetylcholine receptor subunit beta-type acr-2-like [Apostichopus japonicus]|uniref:acetylcholine receptor subunit beta-type acr-2-like n=1 Tax=Stichopus japonicus TaxID=307972 RepID=UPI003AB41E12